MPKNVGGTWGVAQGNGHNVAVTVAQERPDGFFTGIAKIDNTSTENVSGQVTDSEISFLIGHGRYVGHFDFEGRLSGLTIDGNNGTSQATWFASKLFEPL